MTDGPQGTVSRLSTTVVKGLALEHPASIELTAYGAVGDRMLYLVDETGRLQSCTHNAGLAGLRATYDAETGVLEIRRGGRVLHRGPVASGGVVETDLHGLRTVHSDVVADPAWSAFFSAATGRQVRLVKARQPAYDVRPVTLLGTASVEELARRSGLPGVDARRFRMLIEFSGSLPHAEDAWAGMLLRVGDALLRVSGPVKRCAATTWDPDTGAVDLQTLRLIAAYRGRQPTVLGVGATFGCYADVVEPGTVSVGDALELQGSPVPESHDGSASTGRPATADSTQASVDPT